METQQTIPPAALARRTLWLKWVLANALASALAVAPVFIAGHVIEAPGAGTDPAVAETIVVVLNLLLRIVVAILVGMLQWLALRRYVRWANQWWLVTSIGSIVSGFLAPYAAFAVLGARPSTLSYNALTAPVNAAVVGIFQCFVLHKHVRRAGWWVLASIAAWTVAERLGLYAGFYVALYAGAAAGGLGQDFSALVFSASLAAVVGALASSITGIVLVWLRRHPHLDTPAIS